MQLSGSLHSSSSILNPLRNQSQDQNHQNKPDEDREPRLTCDMTVEQRVRDLRDRLRLVREDGAGYGGRPVERLVWIP